MKMYLKNRMCFPVKGINRGVIYDLTRMDYHFVPLNLFELINTDDTITQTMIDDLEVEKEWIDFLENNEVVFSVNDHEAKYFFPPASKNFEIPCSIISLIIHDNFVVENNSFIKDMYIPNISIICDSYDEESFLRINKLLTQLCACEVDSIYIYVKYQKTKIGKEELKLLEKHPQLFTVFLFDDSQLNLDEDDLKILEVINIPYSFEYYINAMTQEKLRINYSHFFESQNFHNYFYKKLYIDEQGEIKNGLTQDESYGNINNVDVLKIVDSESFQKLWNVKKEQTSICKDCEFRFMCVDSRFPKQNKNGEWYHDIDCNYNPYISKWEHEENYQKLEECGITLNEEGKYNIDEQKLNTIFSTVWSS